MNEYWVVRNAIQGDDDTMIYRMKPTAFDEKEWNVVDVDDADYDFLNKRSVSLMAALHATDLKPGECRHVVDGAVVAEDTMWLPGTEPKKFKVGDVVRHREYGIGTVDGNGGSYVDIRWPGGKAVRFGNDDFELYEPPVKAVAEMLKDLCFVYDKKHVDFPLRLAMAICAPDSPFIIIKKPGVPK